MSKLDLLLAELHHSADPVKAENYARFFKTGPGEYGAGDKFLGITVPRQRQIIKKFLDLSLSDLHALLNSGFHEQRLMALVILKHQYQKAQVKDQKTFFDFYLAHTGRINNWDLVDISAPGIVGDYLRDKNRSLLYQFARSRSLWERRIAIMSTFTYIKNDDFKDALAICKILLSDSHDLIHKATGWMLREVGNRSLPTLTSFLNKHYKYLPRTTLRYAIEKFSPSLRTHYLKLR